MKNWQDYQINVSIGLCYLLYNVKKIYNANKNTQKVIAFCTFNTSWYIRPNPGGRKMCIFGLLVFIYSAFRFRPSGPASFNKAGWATLQCSSWWWGANSSITLCWLDPKCTPSPSPLIQKWPFYLSLRARLCHHYPSRMTSFMNVPFIDVRITEVLIQSYIN